MKTLLVILLAVVLVGTFALGVITPTEAQAFPGDHWCKWAASGCVHCTLNCVMAIIDWLNDGGIL